MTPTIQRHLPRTTYEASFTVGPYTGSVEFQVKAFPHDIDRLGDELCRAVWLAGIQRPGLDCVITVEPHTHSLTAHLFEKGIHRPFALMTIERKQQDG